MDTLVPPLMEFAAVCKRTDMVLLERESIGRKFPQRRYQGICQLRGKGLGEQENGNPNKVGLNNDGYYCPTKFITGNILYRRKDMGSDSIYCRLRPLNMGTMMSHVSM
jgi:hypothetical protein